MQLAGRASPVCKGVSLQSLTTESFTRRIFRLEVVRKNLICSHTRVSSSPNCQTLRDSSQTRLLPLSVALRVCCYRPRRPEALVPKSYVSTWMHHEHEQTFSRNKKVRNCPACANIVTLSIFRRTSCGERKISDPHGTHNAGQTQSVHKRTPRLELVIYLRSIQ